MLSLIVAIDENNLIGNKNSMPWNIPEDLKLFKEITDDSIVIMGRKTFQSIGKPLPNRINFILSKDVNFFHENTSIFNCPDSVLEKALALQKINDKKIFIIGGKTIYEYFLPLVSELHFSYIKGNFFGDTYFPEINISDFRVIETREFSDFTYVHYIKKHL